jgi:hypothetical protein
MKASGGMTYIPNFMNIGAVVQAKLRFCLRKSRCYNFDITDETD